MNLNLRFNDYHVFIDQIINEEELRRHNFKIPGFFSRFVIASAKDEIVWWAKNCRLKYLNDETKNSISPDLDTNFTRREMKIRRRFMFGTSAFLWYKRKRLNRLTFQIIQNERVANGALKILEEEIIDLIGKPTSSDTYFVTWEKENYKFVIEYPQRVHGYFHLVSKDL